MRSNEEIRKNIALAPALLAILHECFSGVERGLPREIEDYKFQFVHCVVQSDGVENRAEISA